MRTQPMSNLNTRTQAGFSLVELLMVAFILGVGMLGLAALQTAAIRAGGGSRNRDAAAYLANNVLESLATDGRTCSSLRTNGATPPAYPTMIFGTVPLPQALDTATAYTDRASGNSEFALDGSPVAVGTGIFTANYVIRTNKGGNSAAITKQFGNEVVVNANWKEAVRIADGTTQTVDRWVSMSRFIRY